MRKSWKIDEKILREVLNKTFILSSFDPLLLGYEKKCNPLVRSEDIRNIYTLQGIIKPVIVHKGKIIATWNTKGSSVCVDIFEKDSLEYYNTIESMIEEFISLTSCSSLKII